MKISIVVPVYNGQDTIAACLESLVKQRRTGNYPEILVVDDGSTDGTREIVARYPEARLICQPSNQGPAAARNRGAMEASGEIILFTDADCTVTENWLDEMLRPFYLDSSVVGVKGSYRTLQLSLTARFVQLEYEDKYDLMNRKESIDFIDTYSAAYQRALFLDIGGFDCRFPVACAEDVELSFRIAEKGHRLVFNRNAVVFHLHPEKWSDYVEKKYKFAYWRVLALRKFPRKAIRDSHTPFAQKVQLILLPFSIVTLLLSPLLDSLKIASQLGWGVIFISMVPFIIKSLGRDLFPALATPLYLIPRALVQFSAVLMNLKDALVCMNKPNDKNSSRKNLVESAAKTNVHG